MNTGLYFSVQIGDLPKNTFDVVEFNLEEALSELFTLTLSLSSKNSNIDLQAQLLQKVTFTIYCNGVIQRTVNALVEKAEHGDSGFERTFYTFVARPTLWQLTLTKDSRIYHFKSVPDIIDEILQNFGIVFDKQLMDPHDMREYITMKRESYFDFIQRLAAEEGISFWFEENQMFYSDSRLGMTGGLELIYNPHPQAATRESTVSRLTFGACMRPTEVKLKDYLYTHPTVMMDAHIIGQQPHKGYSVYDSYGRYDDESKASRFAQYRLEALQANSQEGNAFSNNIRLMPGKMFTLSEHPTNALNRGWQIVRISHRGTLPQSLDKESGESAATLTNHFSFISSNYEWRPPFMHKPLADGNETATVVGPAGEEIYVNEDGAVKVHFHWNYYDKSDENASCWVRVAQNWNGDGFGFLATPRIGQEVIISYLNGDIDRPIITGTVYNGCNRPPLTLPEAKTQMTIKSKTHKGEGFNELRFEDENGKQEVFLHAQKDMNTKVLNDRSTHVLHDHAENVDNNQAIVIGVDQNLNVGNDQTETIGNDRSICVENNDSLLVESNQFETVAIAKTETIGAAKALSIGAAYQITVGGAMNTTVGLMQSEEIGLSKTVIVGRNYSQIVNKNKSIIINKNCIQKIGSNYVQKVTKNHSQTVEKSKTVNVAKHTKFIIGESFEIICGKSKLRMDKNGNITINGHDFSLGTTGEQFYKARGEIKMKAKKIKEN